MGRNGIEEVTVVAHYEHGMFEVCQEVLQPFHSVEVEVVGRFVEQEVVGIAIECLCKHHAHFFLTCQFRHHLIVQVFLDTQTGKQLGSIALGIPTVEFGKFLFQFGSTNAILVAEVLFGIEGIFLLNDVP